MLLEQINFSQLSVIQFVLITQTGEVKTNKMLIALFPPHILDSGSGNLDLGSS